MTRRKGIRDHATSVRQRLLNLARKTGVEFSLVLERYAVERFLFRLGASGEADRFTLKGAALFRVWDAEELRPTRDVDFLASGIQHRTAIRKALEAICEIRCPEDGVVFDPATIRLDTIQGVELRGAMRVRIQGVLARARLHLQIDIGFGDVVTPGPQERNYPTLLDLPAPRLWTYPRETLIAEKIEALVRLGLRNSRVKDLWDIACLGRRFAFDGETLRTALAKTFGRRETPFGRERPVGLLPGYYEDTMRVRRWNDLRRQVGEDAEGPAGLVDAGEELRRFVGPVYDSLIENRPFIRSWPPGGPWRPETEARTQVRNCD